MEYRRLQRDGSLRTDLRMKSFRGCFCPGRTGASPVNELNVFRLNLYSSSDEVRKLYDETPEVGAPNFEKISFVAVKRATYDTDCASAHCCRDLARHEVFRIFRRTYGPDETGHVILRNSQWFKIPPPLSKRNCNVLIFCTIGSINESDE